MKHHNKTVLNLSIEDELVIKTKDLFNKFSKQNTISKGNLITIHNKLKSLRDVDEKKWKKLTNRSNTILRSKSTKGSNLATSFIKFNELKQKFNTIARQ